MLWRIVLFGERLGYVCDEFHWPTIPSQKKTSWISQEKKTALCARLRNCSLTETRLKGVGVATESRAVCHHVLRSGCARRRRNPLQPTSTLDKSRVHRSHE